MNLVLLSSDLLVSSRVDGVAAILKIPFRNMTSPKNMEVAWDEFPADLVLIDLMLAGVDLEVMIGWLRSQKHSVTVIAFAPHVYAKKISCAKEMGCDRVYVRGEFLSQLESIISSAASKGDADASG